MKLLGLTGTIASGKSTIADMLIKANVPVIDADVLSRQVTAKGEPALDKLVKQFGSHILNPDHTLNRGLLGQIIFADPQARLAVEKIVHPAIQQALERELAKLQEHSYVVYVAPLIFEKKLQHKFYKTILVFANQDILINRLINRDKLNHEDALLRINSQMSTEAKIKLADYVINNNDSLNKLASNLDLVWEKITGKKTAMTQ